MRVVLVGIDAVRVVASAPIPTTVRVLGQGHLHGSPVYTVVVQVSVLVLVVVPLLNE